MTTYHHPARESGDDFHALLGHDVERYLADYRRHRQAGEFYEHQSVVRRITQGVPGARSPMHAGPRDVQSRQNAAVIHFVRIAEADAPEPRDLQTLCALLEIQQVPLPFAASPLTAA